MMLKGRGAQTNPDNKFVQNKYNTFFAEGIDDWDNDNNETSYTMSMAKSLVHAVDSPDISLGYSANAYHGCEHGCVYCYARNSHQYWDLNSGLDFERKIIVKENAPELFKAFISKKNWNYSPIHLSGNTDCYQPAERKFKLTRQILTIALNYKQPISIITKNNLILRDLDILVPMAEQNLIKVFVSITSLSEDTRRKLEPRTVTAEQRLKLVQTLNQNSIPVGVNVAPIIPGLTDHEIPKILQQSSSMGAKWANYIIVRLNGQIGDIFRTWLEEFYPDRANKIWNSICACHNGKVSSSIYGQRMKGSGNVADIIAQTFKLYARKYNLNKESFKFPEKRTINNNDSQLSLF